MGWVTRRPVAWRTRRPRTKARRRAELLSVRRRVPTRAASHPPRSPAALAALTVFAAAFAATTVFAAARAATAVFAFRATADFRVRGSSRSNGVRGRRQPHVDSSVPAPGPAASWDQAPCRSTGAPPRGPLGRVSSGGVRDRPPEGICLGVVAQDQMRAPAYLIEGPRPGRAWCPTPPLRDPPTMFAARALSSMPVTAGDLRPRPGRPSAPRSSTLRINDMLVIVLLLRVFPESIPSTFRSSLRTRVAEHCRTECPVLEKIRRGACRQGSPVLPA